MLYSVPADVVVFSFDGIPTGLAGSIGVQVQRALTGTVLLARTESGIDERPAGSGNYVVVLTVPSEQDTYLAILDWSGGVPTPSTSRVEELRVTATLPVVPTGLGPIADVVRSQMGTTYDSLVESDHYGSGHILRKIDAVKNRVMNNPPALSEENTLDVLVIDYLGKLATIELIPAAFDYWAAQLQTESTGNDPSETISYPDRIRMLEKLLAELLRQTRRDELLVLPILDQPRGLDATLIGPAIDEIDDIKVTADPRDFPPFETYPCQPVSRRRGRVF